jgi:hypothetical protein
MNLANVDPWERNNNIFSSLKHWKVKAIVLKSIFVDFIFMSCLVVKCSNLSLLAMNIILWMIFDSDLYVFGLGRVHYFEHFAGSFKVLDINVSYLI